MRPRRYNPMWDDASLLGVGALHGVSGPDDDPEKPVGMFLVPDVESRNGWREYYVKPVPKPGEVRTIGFRKPGTP